MQRIAYFHAGISGFGEIKIKMLTGSGAPHVARSTRRRLESREPATRALTSSLCEIQIVFVND